MPANAPLIQGTDFVAVPTNDFDASCHFYGGVLGLRASPATDRRLAPNSNPAISRSR
jgi:hypothetical protein